MCRFIVKYYECWSKKRWNLLLLMEEINEFLFWYFCKEILENLEWYFIVQYYQIKRITSIKQYITIQHRLLNNNAEIFTNQLQ